MIDRFDGRALLDMYREPDESARRRAKTEAQLDLEEVSRAAAMTMIDCIFAASAPSILRVCQARCSAAQLRPQINTVTMCVQAYDHLLDQYKLRTDLKCGTSVCVSEPWLRVGRFDAHLRLATMGAAAGVRGVPGPGQAAPGGLRGRRRHRGCAGGEHHAARQRHGRRTGLSHIASMTQCRLFCTV